MTTIQPKTLLKTQWVGDISQSSLTFEIRHLMIAKIKGSFTDFQIFGSLPVMISVRLKYWFGSM